MPSLYRLAIVDDNETWCYVLALRLQQQGYAVTTFTNVQGFLRQANQFDLVLIDFSIPTPRYQREMDGPEVICQIRRQLADPPVLVLISIFFTPELIHEAAEICPEADLVLSKQTEMSEMFAHIRKLLSERKSLAGQKSRPSASRTHRLVSSVKDS